MDKGKLKELSIEELKAKAKGHKSLMIIFIPLIVALFYFVIRDYMNGNEMDNAMLTIAICTLAGPAVLYPELKSIREEIASRK